MASRSDNWSVVVVGPVGSGKTSLIQRLAYGTVLGSDPTLAPMCYRLETVTYWDTPGDDKFSWASEPLLKRADLVLYCLAPDGDSELRNYEALTAAPVLAVHTKADTTTTRTERDTSAVTGEGIDALTAEIAAVLGQGTRCPAPAGVNLAAEAPAKAGCC